MRKADGRCRFWSRPQLARRCPVSKVSVGGGAARGGGRGGGRGFNRCYS